MSEVQASATLAPTPWWQQRPLLKRFVSDLIADELARLRRNADVRRPQPWPDDLNIQRDLGADSLELMQLATALAESIHLHQSGIEDYLLVKRNLEDWVEIAHAGLAHFSDELTFRTSGSSGVPKTCVHSSVTLSQEVEQLAGLFGGRRRVISAVPSHHIYGFLFTVLLPNALGLDPDTVIDVRNSSPARLARCVQPRDLVIAYPDFWHAVARTVPQLPADVIGVTSTAPCTDHISEAIECLGIDRLFHIYGSSETGGIGWRSSYREPYRLFPYWTFAVGPGALLRTLPDGSQQAATCQDALDRLCSRTFRVGTRRDAAVQIGGVNVFPAHVSSVLERHPQVQAAAVRIMRPDEGSRLKAYVVLKPEVLDPELFLVRFRDWIDQELPAPQRPKALCIGPCLPVSASGKLCDWSIDVDEASGER